MVNILLIGAGQLGSRHLQGLAKMNTPCKLYVVDPFEASLLVARNRFLEVNQKPQNEIVFTPDLNAIPEEIEIAILATTADIRFQVLTSLIERCSVKYILFEKVLFQAIDDYSKSLEILKKKRIKAWVNCSRRTFPFYKFVKETVSTDDNFVMSVIGGEWGLCCNGIHFADLMCFLSANNQYHVDTDWLEPIIEESKRKGFFEVTGSLRFRNTRGDKVLLHAHKGSTIAPDIVIVTKTHKINIQESIGKMIISKRENNWKENVTEICIPFQSNLTNIVVEEILSTGNCGLTSFSESVDIHKPFILSIHSFFKKLNHHSINCPIT